MTPLVIAIDGPAGSGKSTVSRAVAERLGLEVLDSGAMYRAATLALLEAGVALNDTAAILEILNRTSIEVGGQVLVNGRDVTDAIRTPEVTAATSAAVATNLDARALLIRLQREWMEVRGGGVAEGRDMTTTVFPDAAVRVFLYADPEVRAARRGDDERAAARELDGRDLDAELATRDAQDSTHGRITRLEQVPDGVTVIDSSRATVNEVVSRIVGLAQQVRR